MPISEHSLLLVIVFTDVGIIILLTTTWLSSGIEPFLKTWLIGTLHRPCRDLRFRGLLHEFGVMDRRDFLWRAGDRIQRQWPRLVSSSGRAICRFGSWDPIILVVAFATVVAMLSGYVGLSIIIWQAWAAACGVFAAVNYWMARAEAPVALSILTLFYLALATPYALSAGILILDGNMFVPRPDNWADQASRLVAS